MICKISVNRKYGWRNKSCEGCNTLQYDHRSSGWTCRAFYARKKMGLPFITERVRGPVGGVNLRKMVGLPGVLLEEWMSRLSRILRIERGNGIMLNKSAYDIYTSGMKHNNFILQRPKI